MAFRPEYHMPGAYNFDSGNTAPSHPLSAGIFRPPLSPSASSYNLGRSTGSLYSEVSMSTTPIHATGTTKRKRMSTRESTPVDWNMNMDGVQDGRDAERRTAAGRQIRYTLAGQINATPAGPPNGIENGILEDSVYSDIDYRRALGPREVHDDLDSPSNRFAEKDSVAPDQPSSPRSLGWSSFALNTIGEVVGKVLEFCKNGVFRGFHAGGGDGYEFTGSGAARTEKVWCNEHDVPTLQTDVPQSFPSQFQQQPRLQQRQEYASFPPQSPQPLDDQEMSTPESTPRPAVKRRQVSENDELRRNWVMVDEPQNGASSPRVFGAPIAKAPPAPRPSIARTRNSAAGGYYSKTAASTGRRINVPISRVSGSHAPSYPRSNLGSLRVSHAGSPGLAAREPASFAQPRSPITRASPSRIPVPVSSSPARPAASPNPSFGFSHHPAGNSRPSSRQSRATLGGTGSIPPSTVSRSHRHHTNASVAIPTAARRMTAGGSIIDVNDIQASPRLTAEAKELAQKKLAAERDADARVDAFNAHILDMIRQGKEALGTTVEVFDDDGPSAAAGRWEDED